MFKKEGIIWKILLFLGMFFIFINIKNAYACQVDYSCNDWSSCVDGFQIRTCTDSACGQPNIYDRRVCTSTGEGGCKVNLQCDDWTRCTYYNRADDILSSQIKYSGTESRFCTDLSGCTNSFSEERSCSEGYNVNFVKVEQCGSEFLMALDPGSHKSLAKININAWRNNLLDISFVQSNFTYCPSCYNGYQDGNETGIDCGGSCKICGVDNTNRTILIPLSWIVVLITGLIVLRAFFRNNKYMLHLELYRAYIAIEKRDIKNLKSLSKNINKRYLSLSEKDKQEYSKEIYRFKERMADFNIKSSK